LYAIALTVLQNQVNMKNNILYVFFGVGTEYTLNPLYNYMKEQGYNCIEITTATCNDMKKALCELKAKECIFITSAHVFLDETYSYYINESCNLSALEAIDILKPVKIVHYPHDLSSLLHDFDLPWLYSIFDLILFPFDGYTHLSCNGKPIYNVGWIKKLNKTGIGKRFQVGHGTGENSYYYNLGLEHIYNIFCNVWKQGVIIKDGLLKQWNIIKQFYDKNKLNYIEPSKSIFELIDSCEIMLTNSLTSINLESALSGRYTINMLDGIFEKSIHEKYFGSLPNLKILTIDDTVELLKDYYNNEFIPPQGEDLLKCFDFKLAVKLIAE